MTPSVSIVTATYNRSNVLRYAIQSVLWQTVEDWELWVIGDACTDDTEEVVRSFADSRIHFHNLAQNVGEQSGPNNEGVRRAAGEYVAFLSHDDLWFPDHLERCLETIRSSGADLVHSLLCCVHPDGRKEVPGIPQGGPVDFRWVPASCWLFRRTLYQEIGPWRYYRELRCLPSEDWLWRVTAAGRRIVVAPALTVLAIPSGHRRGSYSERQLTEEKDYFEQMSADVHRFRELELVELLLAQPARLNGSVGFLSGAPVGKLLRALTFKVERRLLRALAPSGRPVSWRRLFRPKGSVIDRMRVTRGLPRK